MAAKHLPVSPRRNKRTIHDRGNTTLVLAKLASGHRRGCLALSPRRAACRLPDDLQAVGGPSRAKPKKKFLERLPRRFFGWSRSICSWSPKADRRERAELPGSPASPSSRCCSTSNGRHGFFRRYYLASCVCRRPGGATPEGRAQRRLLVVQPSALARRRAWADRRRPVRRRPLHHPRNLELPVWARASGEMARAHLDRCGRLPGPGELARARPAELHRPDQRRGARIHHPRRRHHRQVRAGAAAPCLHRHPLCLCLKIGLAGTLPKGTLGSLVVGYLLAGAATLLLAYPIRDSGGALVRLFWRYWVWLSVLPVLLLFLAVYTRIAAYGLTEPRYAVVLIGVWALILAVWRMVRRGENFDLRGFRGCLRSCCLRPRSGLGVSSAHRCGARQPNSPASCVRRGCSPMASSCVLPRGATLRSARAPRGCARSNTT